MKLRTLSASVTAGLALLALAGVADAKLTKSGDARIAFTAVGPAGLKFEGVTKDVSINDDGTTVTIVVPLANLATGIDLRDRHMKDKYLEVAKFPTAELAVPKASLKLDGGEGDAQGTFKLHGVSKPVSFHYNLTKSGDKAWTVEGKAKVNMKEHGVEVPNYLGVTVKPEVDVVAKFEAKDG